MIRFFRLMEAIGHAYSYHGKPITTTPTNSGRAADTAGRPTHQRKPLARRKHQ